MVNTQSNLSLHDFFVLAQKIGLCSLYENNFDKYGNVTSFAEIYRHPHVRVFLPVIYCVDGFNISIQGHQSNYCGSENGTQTWGEKWIDLEWGYPSQEIDPVKYNAINPYEYYDNNGCVSKRTTTIHTVGRTSIEKLQELLNEHGGIDWVATIKNFNILYNG